MPAPRLALLLALAVSPLGCAASAPPAAPPAQAAPSDAAALFARFKAATGGAAWDAVQAVASEGTMAAGGLSGPVTTLEDCRGGRSLSRYTLGPVQGAEGFDGARPWEQDPGGEVTAHDAPEALEAARTDAWLTMRGFFRADLAGAEVAPPREQVDGAARYLVVDATPRGGRAVALWFDARTSLLARTVMRRGAKTVTTTLGDYRAAGVVRVPFHVAQDSADAAGQADPREHVDVALARVALDPRADDASFAMPPMAPGARIDDASGATRVPFQLVNNHIYVDGSIDGKPAHLLVDTGGANVLTPASAARLGLSPEGKLAGSGVGDRQVDLALAHAGEVRLGAAVLARPVFYVLDLGPMAAVEGVVSDGLVGFEMFRRFRVTVDYGAGVLTLTDPARFTPPPGAHVVPFDLAERIPVVTGTLDGLPVRLGTLALGDLAVKDIAGDLFTGDKGAFASPDLAGNLGGGVLRRFAVTFDYDGRRMYLVPGPDFERPDPFDRSGTWLLADGDALKVVAIAPGGAAQKAGLREGDRIVAVGGEPARSRPVGEWRARLREQPAGTHVALRVDDGKAGRTVDLMLSDAIPAHAAARAAGGRGSP